MLANQFRSDAITQDEALQLLRSNVSTKQQRGKSSCCVYLQKREYPSEQEILQTGIPAYVTSVGWMGYSDEKIKKRCEEGLAAGWK
jgi:L-fuconate dehydratase